MAAPIITHFKRRHVEQMLEFRERGWSYQEIAEAMNRHKSTIAKYERIYYRFGLEAFAK